MKRVETLKAQARTFYENGDASHDFAHVERVMRNCEVIARGEDVNLEHLLAAALLHDIVNIPKNHPERSSASAQAAEKSRALLGKAGFRPDEIDRIAAIITEHSFSLGKPPGSRESALLQDADKLDALGAIGIFRTVTTGARMGCSYYDAREPFATTRTLDDKAFTLDHFFVKLLRLPALMNTPAARKEGEARARFMQDFLEQLRGEIN